MHLDKTGYLLPAIATLSSCLIGLTSKANILSYRKMLALMLLALILNITVFTEGSSVKELMDAPKQLRILLYSVGVPHTYNEIVPRDKALLRLKEITSTYNSNDTVIIVVEPSYAIDWRRAMYYIKRYTVI